MASPFIDLTGRRYVRLLVIAPAGKDSHNNFLFKCLCDCGKVVVKRGSHLRLHSVQSCGCLGRELAASRNKLLFLRHGLCGSPTYESWSAMLARCTYVRHPAWDRYGGRGITVCEKWKSFENFLVDMGLRPEGATIDRIDNDKNYEPGNCRWATPSEQQNNMSTNRVLEWNGTKQTLSQWARITGIKNTTISERLKRGWSVEDALSKKVIT
jgi:hypothetical protein